MKNLKITTPEGYEIDKQNSTFENIVFKPIKKELPKSFYELKDLKGIFTTNASELKSWSSPTPTADCRNIFATKEQAEASLALAQLSQLREVYRDGWKPDWSNLQQHKYCIRIWCKNVVCETSCGLGNFLSFQSEEVRDLFLENFCSLIEQAKPLMS